MTKEQAGEGVWVEFENFTQLSPDDLVDSFFTDDDPRIESYEVIEVIQKYWSKLGRRINVSTGRYYTKDGSFIGKSWHWIGPRRYCICVTGLLTQEVWQRHTKKYGLSHVWGNETPPPLKAAATFYEDEWLSQLAREMVEKEEGVIE